MTINPEVDLLRIFSVALADTPPRRADAAYVFSETADNAKQPLGMAASLFGSARVQRICCSGSPPHRPDPNVPESFPGFEAWKSQLIEHGVRADAIHGIPMPIEMWHTGVEAYELVMRAKREGWKTLFAVAPPLHLPRCFANTISVALREKVDVQIYAVNPTMPSPWHETVLHSWGRVTAPRIELIDGERERMLKRYGNKYDLCDLKDILGYLARRDAYL